MISKQPSTYTLTGFLFLLAALLDFPFVLSAIPEKEEAVDPETTDAFSTSVRTNFVRTTRRAARTHAESSSSDGSSRSNCGRTSLIAFSIASVNLPVAVLYTSEPARALILDVLEPPPLLLPAFRSLLHIEAQNIVAPAKGNSANGTKSNVHSPPRRRRSVYVHVVSVVRMFLLQSKFSYLYILMGRASAPPPRPLSTLG